MMIRLRVVHALRVLPRVITQQTKNGEDDRHEVENRGSEDAGDGTVVLPREADGGGRVAVGGEEDEPDDHRARDGDDGVLGPDVGD